MYLCTYITKVDTSMTIKLKHIAFSTMHK